ncbi:MAG: class I mannose-6-phosphate isomerase [Bryobacteraceae bacterium]
MTKPLRLTPLFRERLWGRENLAPYFSETPQGKRIGEVWFTCEENPDMCPLLIKLLFTAQRLSVQVHPGDEYAERRHRSLGKTEAWYVLDSQPPGELAVGFRETLTPERLKSASQSGEIAELLAWRKVRSGDVIFVPAGTVHAIGAGLTICEIQQNSDITYRLYDYGRPRDLHLEDAVSVSHLGECDSAPVPVALASWRDQLLACKYFRMERLRPNKPIRIERGLPCDVFLICVKGSGAIASQSFAAGHAWMVPAHCSEVEIEGPGSEWLAAYTADETTSAFQECS